MKVYRVDLVLHDHLFFATTERGKIAETGGFIHNYALAYALTFNNRASPWLKSRPAYRCEKQAPRYREELADLGMYVTPARMTGGSFALTQYNTQWEGYAAVNVQSAGYPNWGFIKSPRPGSTYRFYVICEATTEFPRYVRLGKFMTKAKLAVDEAIRVDVSRGRGLETDVLLNWNDLAVKPTMFDVIANALPTRLVYNAAFAEAPGAQAVFRDGSEVAIPLEMGYLKG